MKFDYRDILAAPRLALSFQRIWMQFLGLLIGYGVYFVFTTGSLIVGGMKPGDIWSMFGVFPCVFAIGANFPWYVFVLAIIGILVFLFILLITNTAVSRVTFMQKKGHHFYSWKEGYAFATRKTGSIIATPVSLIILIALLILGAFVFGWLGKIPFVGEIGTSLFIPIWFFASLFLLFVAIVAIVSIILLPAILATTDDDAFEAVFQSFSITWAQPIRFFFYLVIVVALSFISISVLAVLSKKAIVLMNLLFSSSMGVDFNNLANNGQALLQSWTISLQSLVDVVYKNCASSVCFSKEFLLIPSAELGISVVISSYIYAIGLFLIGGFIASYGLAVVTVGNTISYLVLRKHKDGENLLERVDAEDDAEIDESEQNEESTKE